MLDFYNDAYKHQEEQRQERERRIRESMRQHEESYEDACLRIMREERYAAHEAE